MTRPPRIFVGAFSAEKTGTVTSFRPMPMPSKTRVAASSPHFCVRAIPNGAIKLKMAPMKIVPLLPSQWLKGSEIHPANNQMAMYGQALTNPMIHEFLSQVPSASQNAPVSGMPMYCGKPRLAPLLPVFLQVSSICVKARAYYLIPALNGSSDGIENDGKVQNPWMFPAMCDFFSQKLSIGLVELEDLVDRTWRLCCECTLSQ